MQRFTGVHRSGTAFDVVNLSSFVDDDQRSFELPHVLFVDTEVSLQWVIELHEKGYERIRTAYPEAAEANDQNATEEEAVVG